MKRKVFSSVSLLAIALIAAFGANAASATTFEVGGVTRNSSVTFTLSLEAGSSAVWSRTDGTHMNSCTGSHMSGATTSPFTGTALTAPLSALSFSGCNPGAIVVHQPGQIWLEHISGTTDAAVWSENAELTIPTTLGFTGNCKTGAGTKIGTLTGVSSGKAKIHINAVVNCGFLVPS
ncbi:MAG TPA: hypothetical protein VGK41_01935, partial [Solirubrobacterales bacterium]